MIALAWDWLTGRRVSLYGLAVCRILLGFGLSLQLILNAPDRAATWGAGVRWSDPTRIGGPWPGAWPVASSFSSLGFDLFYLATIGAAIALMLGWHTRIATAATLVGWMSLALSAPLIETGGDAVMRIVLFYLLFTSCGRVWSLDARRSTHRNAGESSVNDDGTIGTALHNLALILIVHQVIMVYVGSALWKVQSTSWTDGTAIYYPLHVEFFSPWLDQLGWLYGWAPFVLGGTWVSLAIQLALPLLLLHRRTRVVAFVAITAMHLGIGALMGIMYFSLVMIAADCVLVSDASWTAAEQRWRDWWGRRRGARGADREAAEAPADPLLET